MAGNFEQRGRRSHDRPGAGARPEAPDPGQYLTFRIADEVYAVPMLETSRVLEYEQLTPVPGAPAWVVGLLNLRGRSTPILDLATKFGATDRGAFVSSCIVVLEIVLTDESSPVGLIVDEMPGVIDVGPDQVAEAPHFGTRVHARYLRGMLRLTDGLALVLDTAGALTAQETVQLSELAARDSRRPEQPERPEGETPGAEG